MECAICLEKQIDSFVSIYNCSHKFHENCISRWANNCPLCRAERKSLDSIVTDNIIIAQCYDYEITPSKYLETFNQYCIDSNHIIEISKPYGVVLNCKTCGVCKAYNWLR